MLDDLSKDEYVMKGERDDLSVKKHESEIDLQVYEECMGYHLYLEFDQLGSQISLEQGQVEIDKARQASL